jgi:hypothetical protein
MNKLNEQVSRMREIMGLPNGEGKHIVYHAGEKKITRLVPDFIKGGPRALYGWGVYFSDSIHKAKDYGKEITYLDISDMNILDLQNGVDLSLVRKVKNLVNGTQKRDVSLAAYYEKISKLLEKNIGVAIEQIYRMKDDIFMRNTDKLWSEMLVKLNYDVLKYNYEYVVINFDKANHYLIDNETGLQSGLGNYVSPEDSNKVSLDDIIPDTEENAEIRNIVLNSDDWNEIKRTLNILKTRQQTVRNNRDYMELQREIDLLEKLLDSDYMFGINEVMEFNNMITQLDKIGI